MRRAIIALVVLVLLGVVIVAGVRVCRSQGGINRSTAIGVYRAHTREGVETLALRGDGTYVHQYRDERGSEVRQSNRWVFDPGTFGFPVVTCYDIMLRLPEEHEHWKRDWTAYVYRSFWGQHVRLGVESDMGYYYFQKVEREAAEPPLSERLRLSVSSRGCL